MTESEAMDQFDRLVAVSAPLPDFTATFREWFRAFQWAPVQDVADGVTTLIGAKSDRFFPTIGELRDCIGRVQQGRARGEPCPRCHGSKWIDADPFTANGGLVYANTVIRCPDCGTPPPNTSHLSGKQTPLTPIEIEAWRAQRGPKGPTIRTQEEFRDYLRTHSPKPLPPGPHE